MDRRTQEAYDQLCPGARLGRNRTYPCQRGRGGSRPALRPAGEGLPPRMTWPCSGGGAPQRGARAIETLRPYPAHSYGLRSHGSTRARRRRGRLRRGTGTRRRFAWSGRGDSRRGGRDSVRRTRIGRGRPGRCRCRHLSWNGGGRSRRRRGSHPAWRRRRCARRRCRGRLRRSGRRCRRLSWSGRGRFRRRRRRCARRRSGSGSIRDRCRRSRCGWDGCGGHGCGWNRRRRNSRRRDRCRRDR